MNDQVDIKINADSAAAQRALEQIAQSFEKISQKAGKSNQEAKGLFSGTLGEIGKFTAGMVGAATVTQALSTAVNALRREYEQFLQRARDAAQVQIPFGDAFREMAHMLGDMAPDVAAKRALGIAGKTGVRSQVVVGALSEALGAGGADMSDATAFGVVEQAAKHFSSPHATVDQLSAVAQAQMSILKSFPGTTPEQAMAAIMNSMKADRGSTIESFSTHLLPAIVASRSYGSDPNNPLGKDSYRDLAAFGIALGQRADDPSGRRTATGLINYFKQLRTKTAAAGLDPGSSLFGPGGMEEFLFSTPEGLQVRQELLGPMMGMQGSQLAAGGGAVEQMLREMQNKMGFSGEAKLLIPFVEYLRGDRNSKTWQLIEATKRSLHHLDDPAAVSEYQRRQAEIEGSPYHLSASLDRQFAAAGEQLLIPNTVLGARGAIRERIPALLRAAGTGANLSTLFETRFDLESAMADSPGDVISAAESVISSQIARPRKHTSYAGPGVSAEWTTPLTAEQEETNAILRELLDTLRNQRIRIESGGEERRGHVESMAGKAGQQP